MLHLRGKCRTRASGIGSHFPRSVPAEKGPFQVIELDVLLAVVVVGHDDDLVRPDEDLVDEVVEQLVACVDGVDRGFGEPLVE